MDQEQPGVFFCSIKHTLRKAAFTEHSENNIIPRKCLANFNRTINLFFNAKYTGTSTCCTWYLHFRKYILTTEIIIKILKSELISIPAGSQ